MDSEDMLIDAVPDDTDKKSSPTSPDETPSAAPPQENKGLPADVEQPLHKAKDSPIIPPSISDSAPSPALAPAETPVDRLSPAAVTTDEPQRSESVGLLMQPIPMTGIETPTPAALSPQLERPLASAAPHGQTEKQLNVADALGYLDSVKMKFQDRPEVYNMFLDIMKEFKSQHIDTPGVINNVSQLFNGHPGLIQGFNTFLPVGYRIECSTDAQDARFITVTTPNGVTMRTTNNGLEKGAQISWSTPGESPRPLEQTRPGKVAKAPTPPPPRMPSPEPPRVPEVEALPFHSGQAIEPALQYVQKIKQRCDAETYRQFLDILTQYRRLPSAIDQDDITRQIARLFKNDPGLRADFRIFMPDQNQLLDDTLEEARHKSKSKGDALSQGAGSSRKRKLGEKEREVAPPKAGSSSTSKSKKSKLTTGQETPTSYASKYSASRSMRYPQERLPPPSKAPIPADDTHFFDRVKIALDNRDTYNEFLKVVNLFTQGSIDTARLLKESRNFLVGDGELMRQWQEILGWDEKMERDNWRFEQEQQLGWSRPTLAGVQGRSTNADLNMKYGSYRKLPSKEVNVTCSGRDDMCRAVLNDEWVSHPTWSSEDSGFIAHKKNIYEEALHRSEEERHEYDFHIDAIVRTISILEPISNKIAQLGPDERGSFKLKPNLGGSAKPIHHRVIKKIYGRDQGLEVIQTMQESPALAIPVVLQRLKQKEEEWKRAQREWNKVWREVDLRNYAKSLDHQSIAFKAADKKAVTTKAFVSQIEAAREEQIAQRASLIDPLFARTRPRHQLEFVVNDEDVLQDGLKLTVNFLDRTQAQINHAERKRIEVFLRSFIPLFFMLDSVSFNSFTPLQDGAESDTSDVDVASIADDAEISSATSGTSRAGKSRKGAASTLTGGDLRKKLLKSEQAKSTNRMTRAQDAGSPSVSRLASPAPVEDETRNEVPGQSRRGAKKSIFFTNTTFYVLLRLIEMLYSRLAKFKSIAEQLASESKNGSNPLAVHLGLLPEELINFGERINNADHFYELFLQSVEKLFDGKVEQPIFEDQMRYMFGVKEAFKAFTLDKLIGAIIKQVQVIFSDPKSQDLLESLKRDRSLGSPTTQDQINSRRTAEKVLGPDENIFRVDWLPDSKTVTVQLIGKDDSSFDDSEVLTGRWQSYIESFVSSNATEGVSQTKLRRPFLRRNMPQWPMKADVEKDDPELAELYTADGLEIKVCVRTYRLFFVSRSEDYLWKTRRVSPEIAQRLRTRIALRQKWLDHLKTTGDLKTSASVKEGPLAAGDLP